MAETKQKLIASFSKNSVEVELLPELRDAIDKALAEVEVEDRERIIENSENG